MRIRTEIKLPPRERKQIEAVAKELQWTITEVIRQCVRASLEWLLDKETNKKLQDLCTDLKQDDDHKDDTTDEITEEMIKIANTKWLDKEDR